MWRPIGTKLNPEDFFESKKLLEGIELLQNKAVDRPSQIQTNVISQWTQTSKEVLLTESVICLVSSIQRYIMKLRRWRKYIQASLCKDKNSSKQSWKRDADTHIKEKVHSLTLESFQSRNGRHSLLSARIINQVISTFYSGDSFVRICSDISIWPNAAGWTIQGRWKTKVSSYAWRSKTSHHSVRGSTHISNLILKQASEPCRTKSHDIYSR